MALVSVASVAKSAWDKVQARWYVAVSRSTGNTHFPKIRCALVEWIARESVRNDCHCRRWIGSPYHCMTGGGGGLWG